MRGTGGRGVDGGDCCAEERPSLSLSRWGPPGRKRHVCHIPECGRTFRKTSLLRAHVRLHTGERPFVCNWGFCTKRFTRSDELQRHARTHTGDKRFECPHCQKRFTRSDHVSKHFKTHLAVTQVETILTLWDPKNDAIAFQVGTPPEMFGLP